MRDRLLTTPEALAAALASLLSMLMAIAYIWGRVSTISPQLMLIAAVVSGVAVVVPLVRRTSLVWAPMIAAVAIFAASYAGILVIAGTTVPPGQGSELTEHLMLIDFIERNWRLPDAHTSGEPLDIAHYTPGLHLLAALLGAWVASDGFHAVFPIVGSTVALKCVFTFLVAARHLAGSRAQFPLALTAVVLTTLPVSYFFGSFLHNSFLPEVAAEAFAVGMWWAAVTWQARPSALVAGLFAVMGIGTMLTWPIWIGPLIATFLAIALTDSGISFSTRVSHLAIAFTPIALVAALHSAAPPGWLAIAGTSGIVPPPSTTTLGLPFVLAAALGIVVGGFRGESRVTFVLALSIAAQAITLYTLATSRGSAVPYLALKMTYLIIYPLAVLGAVALAPLLDRFRPLRGREAPVARGLLVASAIASSTAVTRLPAPAPIVSADLYAAGRWARAHVDAACVDYLVPNRETMHWLHLAVLGNRRASLRSADPTAFDPERALVRWMRPGGLPYAIVHRPTLPAEVGSNLDVLEQFGTAAVVTRRGPSSCADAQRLAGDGSRMP